MSEFETITDETVSADEVGDIVTDAEVVDDADAAAEAVDEEQVIVDNPWNRPG